VSGRGPSGAARGAARGGPAAVRIPVRLTPRGGADRVDGVSETGELLARVSAAPVDGAANEALVRLVAAELGLAKSRVAIVSGASARTKLLEVEDLAPEVVAARWPGIRLGESSAGR
jgi:uncharacterized protein